ncbi:MAG: CDP-diacylglycerol--glycerol-3-phosphate 3-phosphatidyltransferase [Candidatus Hydrogenedentes bacterium]|jgi:CDP-diacylglycerol--glycerol-3-phosphate 3-phosphatidyltransferase|nr:CDP-diacylglycerol--glycerol-3-phosphate 3-phosphatidyltransferase [Candidatus Hydrogenedentota bacterium]
MNLPNLLTIARCILAAFFVLCMSFDHVGCYTIAYLLFIVASITDYYDGKIAREQNLVTNFGKLLDPVADKILMVSAFIMLMGVPDLFIPGWAVIAILAREFLITGARSLAATEGAVIPANMWGKAKTVLQMTYVFVVMALLLLWRFACLSPALFDRLPGSRENYATALQYISLVGIILVAAYTISSGIQFFWANWKALKLHQI